MLNFELRILKIMRAKKKLAVSRRELAKRTGVKRGDYASFLSLLEKLKSQNRLIEKNGKLLLAESLGLVKAEIVKITGTFGFARPENALTDVFIPGKLLMGSLPGDTVMIKVKQGSRELPEGEVYFITEKADPRFSAVVHLDDTGATVLPDSYLRFPLTINPAKLKNATHGDKVLCRISHRGERHSEHIAEILEVFGSANSAKFCAKAVLAANNIRDIFPDEALEQAAAIAAGNGIHPKELAARRDLRDTLIFTIDGADSKDLDDAVSLARTEDGFELGVHIADVSYYITHKTPLDNEAFLRGTSVYFADSVIPMLPKEISNGICSLNPQEDRLAFSALISLDAGGNITAYRFEKTVICSRIKGVYQEVNAILDETADVSIRERYQEVTPALFEMQVLAKLLAKNRTARGSVNLETTESKIILDANQKAVDIIPRERGEAEWIIEEFMLTANEAAANFAKKLNLPFVYRVHEKPAADRVGVLYDTLELLGLNAKRPKDSVSSKQLAKILATVKGTPADKVVNTLVLRSMAKAKYSEIPMGHYGLALSDYAHFTSPIRRYPDLTIHRILSAHVTGMKKENIEKRYRSFAAQSAVQSSIRELSAMTAERDCEDCYKAEYMRAHIGEQFKGVISSVVSFGLYVQLENTVEGLVHISNLPDGEWTAQHSLEMADRLTGRRIKLGDAVTVLVAGVDVSQGTIDFSLVE